MKTTSSVPRAALLSALALCLAISGSVSAQNVPSSGVGMGNMGSMPASSGATKGMEGMSGMHKMMGMHMMPATVDAVDTTTGVVDVTAGGMKLKVHFPPSAVADLKEGDKITLHMGYSKP